MRAFDRGAGGRPPNWLCAAVAFASTLVLGANSAHAVVCGVAGATSGGSVAFVPSGTGIVASIALGSISLVVPSTFGDPSGSPSVVGQAGAFAAQPIVQGAGNDSGRTSALACGDGAVASGIDTTAVGTNSQASGSYGTAIGFGASAAGSSAIAIGRQSFASREESTAIGLYARADSISSIVVGRGAVGTQSDGGIAIGDSAVVANQSVNAIALGVYARPTGQNAVAIGSNNVLAGNSSASIGADQWVNGDRTFVLGSNNNVNTTSGGTSGWGDDVNVVGSGNAVAATGNASGSAILGNRNTVDAQFAVAIGNITTVTGATAVAIGFNVRASGTNAVAIGTDAAAASGSVVIGPGAVDNGFTRAAVYGWEAKVGAAGNVAMGNSASAMGSNSVAIGEASSAAGAGSTALGRGATTLAAASNSVALGQGSVASAANTVSVGAAGSERRVTNVAAGVNPTDAANVSQLSSAATGLQTQISGLQTQINGLQTQITHANSGIAMAMAMGGGFLPDNKRFALATNYGTFAGQSAVAMTAFARLSDNVVLSGSASYGLRSDVSQFGGRVGMQVAW